MATTKNVTLATRVLPDLSNGTPAPAAKGDNSKNSFTVKLDNLVNDMVSNHVQSESQSAALLVLLFEFDGPDAFDKAFLTKYHKAEGADKAEIIRKTIGKLSPAFDSLRTKSERADSEISRIEDLKLRDVAKSEKADAQRAVRALEMKFRRAFEALTYFRIAPSNPVVSIEVDKKGKLKYHTQEIRTDKKTGEEKTVEVEHCRDGQSFAYFATEGMKAAREKQLAKAKGAQTTTTANGSAAAAAVNGAAGSASVDVNKELATTARNLTHVLRATKVRSKFDGPTADTIDKLMLEIIRFYWSTDDGKGIKLEDFTAYIKDLTGRGDFVTVEAPKAEEFKPMSPSEAVGITKPVEEANAA